MKVLALNKNGDITFCTVPPEKRGIGRCNHIEHQNPEEPVDDFLARIEKIKIDKYKKDQSNRKPFIESNKQIELSPYKMTEDEKSKLIKIENKNQLVTDMEGGYIELDEPLWNDMDINDFSLKSGIARKNIKAVLHGELYIVTNSEYPNIPEGKFITKTRKLKLDENPSINIEAETGVVALNRYAMDNYNYEATRDIYVLPYYMRVGTDDIESDITNEYLVLFRSRKNPDKQQQNYEILLNNTALIDGKYTNGYKNRCLADEFAGKGGVFRACLSGSSIPYSGRAVVSPTLDMAYGELKIPATIAVDIYKPTLVNQLAREGKNAKEIESYFDQFRGQQDEIPKELKDDLEKRIKNKRVIMNRQPSLHKLSFQSFNPKISPDATIKVHPAYCDGYAMDFDGDTAAVYAINSEDMIPLVDKELAATNDDNTYSPRNQSKRSILPTKEGLWGLLNILDKRTN